MLPKLTLNKKLKKKNHCLNTALRLHGVHLHPGVGGSSAPVCINLIRGSVQRRAWGPTLRFLMQLVSGEAKGWLLSRWCWCCSFGNALRERLAHTWPPLSWAVLQPPNWSPGVYPTHSESIFPLGATARSGLLAPPGSQKEPSASLLFQHSDPWGPREHLCLSLASCW